MNASTDTTSLTSGDFTTPTSGNTDSRSEYYSDPLQYFYAIISPISLIANAFVVISAFVGIKSAQTFKLTYVSLWNISIVNFLTCLTIAVLPSDPNGKSSKIGCSIYSGSLLGADLSLMISICMLAMERYFTVVRGWTYHFTIFQRAMIFSAVWGFAFCFGFLPNIVDAVNRPGETFEVCQELRSNMIGISVTLIMAILGSIVVPIISIGVYYHVKRRTFLITGEKEIHKRQLKSILLVLFISVTSLFTGLPYILLLTWKKLFCEPPEVRCLALEHNAATPITCLGFTAMLGYPLIYVWWHPPYSKAVKSILCSRRLGLFKISANKDIQTLS